MRRRDAILAMSTAAATFSRVRAAEPTSTWSWPTFGALAATVQPGELGPLSPWGLQTREYVVRTTDGWKLVLRRHWMPDRFSPIPPVILCHGLAGNGRIFELAPTISFADYLAGSGLDAWVVDLRGAGLSEKWSASVPPAKVNAVDRLAGRAVPRRGFASIDPRKGRWTFDDHIDHDVPAILEFVKHVTNKGQASWLGICLGADVALAYLGKFNGDEGIARLATIGGQATMTPSDEFAAVLDDLIAERDFELSKQPRSMDDALTRLEAHLVERSNLAPATLERLRAVGRDHPSTGVLAQMINRCRTGRLLDCRKKVDYSGRLRMIRCPCLFAAGAADPLADVSSQQILLDAVGARDKTMLRLGKESGLSTDYGRGDVLIGESARTEIYPLLTRWLRGEGVGLRSQQPPTPVSPAGGISS